MSISVQQIEFDYPRDLVAQHPCDPRDHSRLLALRRCSGNVEHRRFDDLPDLLNCGDILVLNDTKVMRARLEGRREPTGGKVKLLLLRRLSGLVWDVLIEPPRHRRVGAVFSFGDGSLKAQVVEVNPDHSFSVEFNCKAEDVESAIDEVGIVPLPPYIKGKLSDESQYQTVFATQSGSVAAPTAGLHFTSRLLGQLNEMGVKCAVVTLHVGWATFRPIATTTLSEHKMYREWCTVSDETARLVGAAVKQGHRVVAVGTTTVRTIESAVRANGCLQSWSGWTDLFIQPPYDFQVVDALITNFHLPRSTNLVMASAFAGNEALMNAYAMAIAERYRLFSFGDAMFIS